MSQRTGVGMFAVQANKVVKHHVCYADHSQPTNVGTPTKKPEQIQKRQIAKSEKYCHTAYVV